jgi:hypothetical protein
MIRFLYDYMPDIVEVIAIDEDNFPSFKEKYINCSNIKIIVNESIYHRYFNLFWRKYSH